MTLSSTLTPQAHAQGIGEGKLPPLPVLRLCTGSAGNHYYHVGRLIARAMAGVARVELIETKGSWENLGRAHAPQPQCDALIAQEDAYAIYLDEHPNRAGVIERVGALYPEHVHLVCNRKVKATSVSALPNATRVIIGPYGSGTYITWTLMKRLNQAYQRLRDFEAIGDEALLKVVDGAQVQCMLSVNALAQGLIARAHDEFGARLHLITIDDPKVSRPLRQANGELRPLYRPTYVHKNIYPLMLTDHLKTNTVDAVMFVQSRWRQAYPEVSEQLIKALTALKPSIQRSVD